VRNAGEEYRFDQKNLGLNLDTFETFEVDKTDAAEVELVARTEYDTSEIGHTNTGHSFGLKLTPIEKAELIEYLKTL
jgi:hypothetical protein